MSRPAAVALVRGSLRRGGVPARPTARRRAQVPRPQATSAAGNHRRPPAAAAAAASSLLPRDDKARAASLVPRRPVSQPGRQAPSGHSQRTHSHPGCRSFLPRDARNAYGARSLLSKDGRMAGWMSHAGIVSKRLKISSNFFFSAL